MVLTAGSTTPGPLRTVTLINSPYYYCSLPRNPPSTPYIHSSPLQVGLPYSHASTSQVPRISSPQLFCLEQERISLTHTLCTFTFSYFITCVLLAQYDGPSNWTPIWSRGDNVLVVKLHHCSVSPLPYTNLQGVCQVYKCSGPVHLHMRCDQGPE